MLYIFLNGVIIPEQEAKISVADRGFLYGDGIFETLRSYNGYLFNIDLHLSRLRNSSTALKIPFDYSGERIQSVIKELIIKNNCPDAYIRITLSRGWGNLGLQVGNPSAGNNASQSLISGQKSTLAIQVKPLTAYSEEFYKNGMEVIISPYKRSISCPISSHKTANFMTNIIARDEAKQKGAHEAIFLNTENHVSEASVSNLFIVIDNVIITPPLGANILPGITRKTVLDICKDNRVTAKEVLFGIDRLMNADECFLTNSLMEIMPVSSIDSKKIGKSVPGRLTRYLMNEYKKRVQLSGFNADERK